ncbi:MAG TPA: dihydrodipicolinate synthase family protein [Bryobacteraceae bacterium]|nr:dihydrodipicolinate synthase family protein [Bryobacteraceae bacterium]
MTVRDRLRQGLVIPAHPLALTPNRRLDERRQRALTRYYLAAGAGGIAVAVHTTQFGIRAPQVGLLKPVLELAIEETRNADVVKIAGICGATKQALEEAELARQLGYDAVLLGLAALGDASNEGLIAHSERVAEVTPVVGFYLQPAVGGRVLPYEFWRRFVEIRHVVGIKMAPFDRYRTLDVIRALIDSGRQGEIALYTGNDDSIVIDLLTEFNFGGQSVRIVGGLLGHWAVWTAGAVSLLNEVKTSKTLPRSILTLAQQVTDMNAAIFDPAHQFHGCIAGIHEVLRRQGLLAGRWCLDPKEDLSPGQSEEIDRVLKAYPRLVARDEKLIRENVDSWLR